MRQLAPLCGMLQHDTTLRTMLNLFIPHVQLQQQAIKSMCNSGSGGCFPIHSDTDAAVDARKITAIW
jgi:hypothetical protein